jgi:hypothetical protein
MRYPHLGSGKSSSFYGFVSVIVSRMLDKFTDHRLFIVFVSLIAHQPGNRKLSVVRAQVDHAHFLTVR